jgi:hypothetical protein
MNLTTKKWSSKKMGFNKHIVAETHIWKNSSLQKNNTKWKFKLSIMFVLGKKGDKNHTM